MRRPIASLAATIGPNSGDLVTEAVLAIEMGADAHDIGLTIHPHRTLSETIAMAAEMVEGSITELGREPINGCAATMSTALGSGADAI